MLYFRIYYFQQSKIDNRTELIFNRQLFRVKLHKDDKNINELVNPVTNTSSVILKLSLVKVGQ